MSTRAVERAPPLSSEPGPVGARTITLCLALGLVVLTTAVYAPVRNYGFIKLDDPFYVTKNRHVRAGLSLDGFVWAWTSVHAATWHPLTSLSHMLDCQLFGLHAGAHHLGNLVLHVFNTLLLFGLLVRMTARPWPSAWVAALFAVHPLHVESVAWISERKDVLSTFFWLLTVWAYVAYVRGPGWRAYGVMLAAYIAALLSKPMVVTLPFVLLLLDWWPLERLGGGSKGFEGSRVQGFKKSAKGPHGPRGPGFKSPPPDPSNPRTLEPLNPITVKASLRLVLEKLPLLLLAAIVSVVTYLAQTSVGAVASLAAMSFAVRLANAVVAYAAYLRMMLWPTGLAVFHPFEWPLPAAEVWGAVVVLVVVSTVVFRSARRYPYLLTGWLWYLGMLVPVIGLVHQGDQSLTDHFTYLPLVGIFIMIAWGVPELLSRWRVAPAAGSAVAVAAVVACVILASHQLEMWQDNMRLFEHALAVTRNNFVAHFCVGLELLDEGRQAEAAARFSESLRIRPTYEPAHFEMGRLLASQGALDAAKDEFLEAVRLNPAEGRSAIHLADIFARQDQLDMAQTWIRRAIDAAPDNPDARFKQGLLAARSEDWDTATAAYTAAIGLDPTYVEARLKLADALLTLKRPGQAIQEYTAAVQLDPGNADAHEHLGVALLTEKRVDEALRAFRQAVQLKPDFAAAYNHWGVALSIQGRFDEAIERYHTALRYDPACEDAAYNLQLAEKERSAGQVSPAP